jgi:hypothetical protein
VPLEIGLFAAGFEDQTFKVVNLSIDNTEEDVGCRQCHKLERDEDSYVKIKN